MNKSLDFPPPAKFEILQVTFCSFSPVATKIGGSFPVPPPFKFIFENLILHCHNAKKLGMVNKLTIMNRFVFHTLQRNITHLAQGRILDFLEGGGADFRKIFQNFDDLFFRPRPP